MPAVFCDTSTWAKKNTEATAMQFVPLNSSQKTTQL